MKTLTCPPALSLHARTTSLCHSQLHALHHHACAGFPLLVCFLFSFSANSLFFSPLTTLLQHHNRDHDTTHGVTTATTTTCGTTTTTTTTTSHATTIATVTLHVAWPPRPHSPTTVPVTPYMA